MRALILGGTGAVGSEAARILRWRGHEVTVAARRPHPSALSIDLGTEAGWRALAQTTARHDVVVNASGREDTRMAEFLNGAGLVEISATGSYLNDLFRTTPADARIALGVGLAPGLTTSLVAALAPAAGSVVDVAVMLGGRDRHGGAAIDWTAGLAGRRVFGASDNARNLVGWTTLPGPHGRRRYLRADFPDDILLGSRLGITVRSHLAIDSRLSTWALSGVGRAPSLRGLITRAPHLGRDTWFVAVRDRDSHAILTASGRRQSSATAAVTALAAERLSARSDAGVFTTPDLASTAEWMKAADAVAQAAI